MLWLDRRARLGRRKEEGVYRKRILVAFWRFLAAAFLSRGAQSDDLALAHDWRGVFIQEVCLFQGLFDGQSGEGEGAHHFKGEEADDINSVVVGFQIEMGREVEKFTKSLGLEYKLSDSEGKVNY